MRLVLAPIAEFSDAPFRQMCFAGGADSACTEMVSAAALRHGHLPSAAMLEKAPGEGRLVCQIFGSDELDLALAAREISNTGGRFAAIDLNAGCPMPRIVRNGDGAALVKSPEKVMRLLVAIKENTHLPVTLKTRLGPRIGETTVFEIADAAASAGAVEMTVHARYVSQMHGGPADLATLAELVSRSKIEITGNGGVTDLDSLRAMLSTGVESVMIARAAMKNPFIFARLKAAAAGLPEPQTPGPPELFAMHRDFVLAFHKIIASKYPGFASSAEDCVVQKFKTQFFRYFSGTPGAAAMRGALAGLKTAAEAEALVLGMRTD